MSLTFLLLLLLFLLTKLSLLTSVIKPYQFFIKKLSSIIRLGGQLSAPSAITGPSSNPIQGALIGISNFQVWTQLGLFSKATTLQSVWIKATPTSSTWSTPTARPSTSAASASPSPSGTSTFIRTEVGPSAVAPILSSAASTISSVSFFKHAFFWTDFSFDRPASSVFSWLEGGIRTCDLQILRPRQPNLVTALFLLF